MKIVDYKEHDRLIPFYSSRGIEELKEYPTKPIFSYVMMNKGEIIGASTCSLNEGVYILEAIAISEKWGGKKLGSQLLHKTIQRAKELGAKYIIINSKNTYFFEKKGFEIVDRSYAPLSEYEYCDNCECYGKTCFPKIMKYDIRR